MTWHPLRAAVVGVLAVVLVLGACGDDDDDDGGGGQAATTTTTAGGDELCPAVDDLRQDVGALDDVDVVQEGTSAVEDQLDAIRDDLSQIRQAAPDTAPDEADAFDRALTSLDDAGEAVGDGELTAESARDLADAAASTVRTGDSYLQALDEACP